MSAGGRYYRYDANGNVICEQDGDFESNGDDAVYHKITKEAEDVYSTDYGWGLFKGGEKNSGASVARYRSNNITILPVAYFVATSRVGILTD